jgi:hypothetical protein
MHYSKAEEKARVRDSWEGKFIYQQHHYSLTPPPPVDGPTLVKPTIDLQALCAHRLYSSQIASLTPLLLPADLGLPLEDLILLKDDFGRVEEQLAAEDADLLNERVMYVKREE